MAILFRLRLVNVLSCACSCWLAVLAGRCFAQAQDTASLFSRPILMDSFVVSSGFDVQAFISRVKHDTTFYKAFKSMRIVPYAAVNDIRAFDRDGSVLASMHSATRQEVSNGCRVTKTLEEQTAGDFYKKDSGYNYYTAALFAYLFFAKEPECGETDVIGSSMTDYGNGRLEKNKWELKQLIFNPGSPVSGIPFMGSRGSIFDPDEAQKYDFSIARDVLDGTECYQFRIVPRPGYEHKVIYNELTTWFRTSDYSIVARNYSLSYHTLVYDFNVAMQVRTAVINGKLYPLKIDYNGNWHVFTKKRERVKFSASFTYN